MIFLELNELGGDSTVTINMTKIELFRSNGTGNTVFCFEDESTLQVKESYEEVKEMLHVALIGNRGVVSLADIAAVVR